MTKDMRLRFGSTEANKILDADGNLRAKERNIEARHEKLWWYVFVHVSKTYRIKAVTGREAMEICAERHRGHPYDAQLVEKPY